MRMLTELVVAARIIVVVFLAGAAMMAQGTVQAAAQAQVLKVPCRDMGDGRTLIDSAYLPESAKNARYTIIATQPASMAGEWANKICTIRLRR